jgi:DNA repair protein RecO
MYSRDQALILRLNPVKDYDLIGDFFCAEHGKLSFYLKNAASPKSKRARSLEALNLVEISWEQRNSLPNIQEIKLKSQLSALKSAASFYSECFVLAEILSKLLPEQEPAPALFQQVAELASLPAEVMEQPITAKKSLCFLILKTLQELGYLPELQYSLVDGEKLDLEKGLAIAPGEIGYINLNTEPSPELARVLKIQMFASAQENIVKFLKLNIPIAELELINRIQLDWIELIIGAHLKSRQILDSKI